MLSVDDSLARRPRYHLLSGQWSPDRRFLRAQICRSYRQSPTQSAMVAPLSSVLPQFRSLESENRALDEPRFLFRGQKQVFKRDLPDGSRAPTVPSKFGRIDKQNPLRRAQAYTTYRWAAQFCTGLAGYTVGVADAVAVLQHHGWPTPFIDLTGTLDVALSFAMDGADPLVPAVIYVVNRTQLPPHVEIADHSFLAVPLASGGLRHRWLRQDGYAISTVNWQQAGEAEEFDLLDPRLQSAVKSFEFRFTPSDKQRFFDRQLLNNLGDPIPAQLQAILTSFCNSQFDGLDKELAGYITNMFP